MKKLPEQFSVYAKTKEEAEYICKKQKEMCGDTLYKPKYPMYYRFSPKKTWDRWGYSSSNYLENPILVTFGINIQHEFTFEEFKSYFEEEFILPEMWYIKDCEEVAKWASKVFDCGSFVGDKYLHVDQKLYPKTGCYAFYDKMEGYTEITFEQFKKYVLKENNMKKEIIGYKLIKPEYKEAACKIGATDLNSNLGKNIAEAKNTINNLKEAGVLDLWFEPVYKEEKQDIVLTLTNGKQVTVTKEGKIMAEGSNFDAIELRRLYARMFEPFEDINGLKITANSINIGCWKNIEARDLKLILETQEKQSK